MNQQKWDDAETLFSESLTHSEADERAHWGMAEVLWQRGKLDEAVAHMQKSAEISGDNPELRVRLGEMHLSSGQLEEALEQANIAIQFNRQHSPAWALRGQVLRRQGQLNEAMVCYQRALMAKPDDPSVQMALAEVYEAMNRPQRALATLDHIADVLPEEQIPARTWMLKGRILSALGESEISHECLRRSALCAHDSDVPLLLELASAQQRAGELAEARILLGRALRYDPNNPNALAMRDQFDQSLTPEDPSSGYLRVLPAGFDQSQLNFPNN